MAGNGITLAETAVILGNKFFDPNCSETKLKSTVELMKTLANTGQTDARRVEAKFKAIRSGLLTVCVSSFLSVIDCWITYQYSTISRRYGVLSKLERPRDPVATLVRPLSLSNCPRGVPGTIHEDQVSFFPCYGKSSHLSLKFPANTKVQTSSTDTEKQLDAASRDVEALTNIISAYVNWWDDRVTNLNALETLSPMASSNDEARRMVRDRWEKITSNFTTYKTQVDLCGSFRPQI